MVFDAPTTLVAICTIITVLGVQLLFFWSRDRQAPWLAWYSAACIFGAVSVLLYLAGSVGREFLVLGAGNACRIMAFAFLWHGAREFAGRKPEQMGVVFGISSWMALCSVPAFLTNTEIRVMAASAYVAVFCGLAAFELWRIRSEALPSLKPTIVTLASFALFAALRIPLAPFAPFPIGALPVSGGAVAIFGLVVFIHAAFLVALIIAITRERREMQQRRHAISDPLTGLLNRRAFEEAGTPVHRRRGMREAMAVLMLDLDDFKSVNDRYGHEAGDLVLQRFAEVARNATRSGDLLYRMGGEEFCFVLPGTVLAGAMAVAERIRTSFAESEISVGGQGIRSTVSIGLAAVPRADVPMDLMLAAADAAAYEAKARGRNQTVIADPSALRRPETTRKAAA